MGLLKRPIYIGTAAVVGVATVALTGAFAATTASAAPKSAPQFTSLQSSVNPTTDRVTGAYHSSRMSVELSLKPRNEASLASELRAEYTKGSSRYHKWLAKGQFDARYAPTSTERNAIASYLRSAGLKVDTSASPFLIRVTGSSTQIQAAFRTSLKNYRSTKGVGYFSNSTAVRLPSSFAGDVLGAVGLTNTDRLHMAIAQQPKPEVPAGKASRKSASSSTSCETPYVTTAQLFGTLSGTGFPYGYGGGPGCSGLTPSQVNSIYGAPKGGGASTKGRGVTLGLFELSAYQASDIDTWAHQFYGPGYTPKLKDVIVDGGPLAPICPTGDTCPPQYEGYSGDIEVDADIEVSLAVAPDIKSMEVYNAPNDYTGQTELDEYTAMANQDTADTISSSWSSCENDVPAGAVEAENLVFEQMAMQGQSVFGAAGDTGAYECLRSDGTTVENVNDPPSQPWMTSVGGTSLENDNPGTNPNPGTPKAGTETVWNVDNLCSSQGPAADNDNQGGVFWCDDSGSGGGGYSQYWGRPFYQHAPGVNNPAYPNSAGTVNSSGITECSLASTGAPCRETPDVSANADEYTPYTEYCTGNPNPPDYSVCGSAGVLAIENVPGWFGIGGTSLSSPLWGALIADRDGYQGQRSGNINPLVYDLLNVDPHQFFNDITGIGPRQQLATNNGIFDTTPGYDMATGAGSPKFAAWITGL
jgi:subtilase family serine protease